MQPWEAGDSHVRRTLRFRRGTRSFQWSLCLDPAQTSDCRAEPMKASPTRERLSPGGGAGSALPSFAPSPPSSATSACCLKGSDLEKGLDWFCVTAAHSGSQCQVRRALDYHEGGASGDGARAVAVFHEAGPLCGRRGQREGGQQESPGLGT